MSDKPRCYGPGGMAYQDGLRMNQAFNAVLAVARVAASVTDLHQHPRLAEAVARLDAAFPDWRDWP